MNQLLSVPEAADELDLAPSTVRRYCQEGRIQAQKKTGAWLITPAAIEKFKQTPRPVGYPKGRKRNTYEEERKKEL